MPAPATCWKATIVGETSLKIATGTLTVVANVSESIALIEPDSRGPVLVMRVGDLSTGGQ